MEPKVQVRDQSATIGTKSAIYAQEMQTNHRRILGQARLPQKGVLLWGWRTSDRSLFLLDQQSTQEPVESEMNTITQKNSQGYDISRLIGLDACTSSHSPGTENLYGMMGLHPTPWPPDLSSGLV